MNNRKMVIAVVAVFFISWLMAIHVGAAQVQEMKKVNINTASAKELTQLKGVGTRIAARIIDFREKNGPFKTAQDLMRVPGIGPKIVAANQELIVVHDPEPPKQ